MGSVNERVRYKSAHCVLLLLSARVLEKGKNSTCCQHARHRFQCRVLLMTLFMIDVDFIPYLWIKNFHTWNVYSICSQYISMNVFTILCSIFVFKVKGSI